MDFVAQIGSGGRRGWIADVELPRSLGKLRGPDRGKGVCAALRQLAGDGLRIEPPTAQNRFVAVEALASARDVT